jgi:hypothetical protein
LGNSNKTGYDYLDLRMSLQIVPLSFRAASKYVGRFHRHNKPPAGSKFCIGVEQEGVLVGVAIVGRPIARAFDNGRTAEVTRTCTNGEHNANSILYGACWRTAKAMGYTRIVTYTQADETGASLRAAGWVKVKELPARKGWAASTKNPTLKAMRDEVGNGGVTRVLWEIVSKT